MYNLKNVREVDVKNKMIFLRADLDVPIRQLTNNNQQSVADDTRLKAWFPTLEYLLKNGGFVILAGHLGRPNGIEEKYSLKPVAKWIAEKFKINDLRFKNFGGFQGWEITDRISLLENLRFHKEEEENNEEFSKKLATLADVFVNDAFASSHRMHASIVGITKHLPSFAGFRILEEVKELSKVLENPKRPLCVIIGGAKIETKLPLVEKMHVFADYVLVGGEIAENDKTLLKVQHEKIANKKSVLLVADLKDNLDDITQKSAENFIQIAASCQTIVWNGPMGLVEKEEYAVGTKILAEGISTLDSHKILGGGDTVSCIEKIGLLDKFDFVSIGGGAMLEFLAGEKLPGLVALEK